MKAFFFLFAFLFPLLGISQEVPPIRVAAAANFMMPMQEIIAIYASETGQKPELVTASSGKLYAQIVNGAPFHLFLSADMEAPDLLWQKGMATSKPSVLVQGQLVFWSKNPVAKAALLQVLQSDALRSIAIPQPGLAPYGTLAREWLQASQIMEAIKPRLVFGESVSRVNQFIHSGAVDAAFTSISAMHAAELKDLGHWMLLDYKKGNKLPHGLVRMKVLDLATSQAIDKFIDFLFSPLAQEVFAKYGYLRPDF